MKKKLGLIIGLLMCFSIMTVGFAAWIITGEAETTNSDGSFVAEQVTEKNMTLTIDFVDDDNQIVFGVPTGSEAITEGNWLNFETDDPVEDLVATATITLTNYEYCGYFNAELVEDGDYKTALEGKLIEKAEVTWTVVEDENTHTATYTVTITFKWGEAFNKMNPYAYYNGMKSTDKIGEITAAAHAKEYLGKVYALNAKTFTLKASALLEAPATEPSVEPTTGE